MRTSNHAKALFELAIEDNKIDSIHYQYESFKDELKTAPTWISMMDSPMVLFSDKVKKIDELPYDGLFLSFLKMLAEKNQMHAIFEIFTQWNQRVRTYLKIAHVNVISATRLSKDLEMRLHEAIQKTFPHHSVSLHMHVDKHLIGGLKVIYQGQALDRSVARELEELYQML